MVKENLFMPHSIKTYSGDYFSYVEMNPDTVHIEDIAHALSHIHRWLGHTDKFYSVAEHCVWCCNNMSDEDLKLEALLHDASEAYIGDIPSPLKKLIPQVNDIEVRLHLLIAQKYKLQYPYPPEVKAVDLMALEFEWRSLKLSNTITGWSPQEAKESFLNCFHKYFNKRQ